MPKHDIAQQHRRKKSVRFWVIGALAIVLVLIATAAAAGMMLYKQAQAVKNHEMNALSVLQSRGDMTVQAKDLKAKLPQMQSEAKKADTLAHGTLWNIAAKMPIVGKDVGTVQGMTAVVSDIMDETLPQLVSLADALQNANLRSPDGGLNLKPIVDTTPAVQQLDTLVHRQIKEYNALAAPKLDAVAAPYQKGKALLDEFGVQIEAVNDTFSVLPTLLGENQVQTYAVMAMTTSEMRSSGGLIGSVGQLTTHNGTIEVGQFRPNAEYLQYGIGDHSEDEKRIFADEGPLNMSFDIRDLAVFTDTARAASAMRSIWDRTPWGGQTPINGVLMIDPVFVQELIAVNGNVTLSDGTVLTGDDTAQFLLNEIYKKYPIEQTDMVFAEVAAQVIHSMFADASFNQLSRIADVLHTMAEERHLSIYSFNEQQEQIIQKAGFTAQPPRDETHPAVGIYLTEQNPSKMGWYLKRSAKIQSLGCNATGECTYHVEYTLTNTITEQEAKDLTWYITGNNPDNTGKAQEKILFYPPAGGEISNLVLLNGAAGDIKPDVLNGDKIYKTYLQLVPGQQAIYSFDVTTAPSAKAKLVIDQTPLGTAGTDVVYE